MYCWPGKLKMMCVRVCGNTWTTRHISNDEAVISVSRETSNSVAVQCGQQTSIVHCLQHEVCKFLLTTTFGPSWQAATRARGAHSVGATSLRVSVTDALSRPEQSSVVAIHWTTDPAKYTESVLWLFKTDSIWSNLMKTNSRSNYGESLLYCRYLSVGLYIVSFVFFPVPVFNSFSWWLRLMSTKTLDHN